MKAFLFFLSISNFLNASEEQVTKYYDSAELQKCDWKSLYRKRQASFFFHLRKKLDTNSILHTRCNTLMNEHITVGLIYDVTIAAIVTEISEFLKEQLADLNFVMPINFSMTKHPQYYTYYKYFRKFVDSVDIKNSIFTSELTCYTGTKFDEINLSAFKDLIAVHISLLVGASVPELKKEEPKREWCHLL